MKIRCHSFYLCLKIADHDFFTMGPGRGVRVQLISLIILMSPKSRFYRSKVSEMLPKAKTTFPRKLVKTVLNRLCYFKQIFYFDNSFDFKFRGQVKQ